MVSVPLRMSNCDCPVDVHIGPTLASICGGSTFMIFMGLLEGFIRSQCDLEDTCGRATSRLQSEPDNEYDFIVVGGGTAGSVIASRLSEIPSWKVLVIEAGGDEPAGAQIPIMAVNLIGSDIDWRYNTEPEKAACLSYKERRCYWPRGKVLGGSSVINGMIYNRGNREDYDNWEAMGNPGWKFSDVLPFFKKSEDNTLADEYHGTGGLWPISKFPFIPPLSYAILKAGEELGYGVHDLDGANSTGFMISNMASKNGVRMSTARAFLRPARLRTNLHILLNTTMAKILMNPSTKNAYGVEIIDQDGSLRKIFIKKEVIISAGVVNSPQILLLSGIGPKEELEKVNVRSVHDLPGVGRNLHNHVSYLTNFFIDEADISSLNWATVMEYLLFRDGPMSGTGIASVTAKMATRYADRSDVPDLQLFFRGYQGGCTKTGKVGVLLSNNSRIIAIVPVVLNAKSRGYLTLASNDPLQPPKIFANYLDDKNDVKTLVEGIKLAIRLAETSPLKAYGMRLDKTPVKACKTIKFATDKYWECAIAQNTVPETHPVGSCKMAPTSDPNAVVDHELRVHGLRGLRVIDSSVMPKVTSGNTAAPTVMIAEKGSYMIKRAWGAEQ